MKKITLFTTLATTLAMLTASACSQPSPQATADEPAPHAEPAHAGKHHAPVALELTTSGRAGLIDVVLHIAATGDMPRAQARVVLPDGVTLVSGALEQDLGAVAAGDKRALAVRVQVPTTGAFTLAGGVRAKFSPGVTLSKAVTTEVGVTATAEPKGHVIKLPEGGSVRRPN